MGRPSENEPFDRAYYERFYGSPRTRAYGPEQVAHLAAGVVNLVEWFGGELRSVLDVGAGTGMWGDWLRANRPGVRYRSLDVSAYACERYGHEQRDISAWRARERFDLVICQGVLPYLDDAACARAIENMAHMSRGFLYLESFTQKDVRAACDPKRSDLSVHRRSGRWYQTRLARHYLKLGCGLHYTRSGRLRFYELERA